MKNPKNPFCTVGRSIAIIAAVVIAIGAFMPWAASPNSSVVGIEGDGLITLLLAVFSIILLFIMRIPCWTSVVIGLVALAIAGINYANVAEAIELLQGSVEYGLYLTIIGSLGVILGAAIECSTTYAKKGKKKK